MPMKRLMGQHREAKLTDIPTITGDERSRRRHGSWAIVTFISGNILSWVGTPVLLGNIYCSVCRTTQVTDICEFFSDVAVLVHEPDQSMFCS